MKFTTPEITFEMMETVDVIASSLEEGTTVSPIDPSFKHDPYLDDKF